VQLVLARGARALDRELDGAETLGTMPDSIKVQKMKKGMAVLLAMMLMPRLSLAEWKIEGEG
jgi:hypothetical protein